MVTRLTPQHAGGVRLGPRETADGLEILMGPDQEGRP